MKPSEYAAVFAAETNHWWYTGMQAITEKLLQELYPGRQNLQILDAGCGTGGAMVYLVRFGHVVGCDNSAHALSYCQKRRLSRLSRAGVEQLPFAPQSFDLITSFDVLYHQAVTDYQLALAEFYRVLKPGGRLFLRLQAYNWLRGHHDDIIETARRFTTGELKLALESSRFLTEKLSYANTLLFPLALAKRFTEKIFPPQGDTSDVYPLPQWQNHLFETFLQMEARWLGQGHILPFGLTVVAVGRKASTLQQQTTSAAASCDES